MTLEEKEALLFLIWLGTVCPTVYTVEIVYKGIENFSPDTQLKYILKMIDMGAAFWTNQELIYRNLPSLN